MQAINVIPGVPNTKSASAIHGFVDSESAFTRPNFIINGVTRDSTGSALPNCVLRFYQSADDAFMYQTVSDASGNYSQPVHSITQYYGVAYLTGSPDVFGTTANTLTGS